MTTVPEASNMSLVQGSKHNMTIVQGPAQNISRSVPKQNVSMQPIHKQNMAPASSHHFEPKVLKPGKNDCGDCDACKRSFNCEKCKFCLKPSLKKKCQLRTCTQKIKHQPNTAFVVQDLNLYRPSHPIVPPIPLKSLPVLSKPKKSMTATNDPVSDKPKVKHHPKPILSCSGSITKARQQSSSAMTKPYGHRSSEITKPSSSAKTSGTKKSTQLRGSSEKEKSFSCHKCGKSFIFPKWLINHMNKNCCMKVTKLKCCPICNKSIKSNYFGTHMKIHSVKMLKCNKCDCRFKNEKTLAAHMKGVHAPRPNILVRCSECDKIFSNDRVLKQHTTKNHGEKTLTCDMCKAMFTTTNGLRKHKLSHYAIVNMMEKEEEHGDNEFENDEDYEDDSKQQKESEQGDNESENSSDDSEDLD